MTNFVEKLKELRLERRLTLKELSSLLDMPLTTYANYEQGKREPSIATLKLICDFYDVSADYLIGRTDSY